MTRSSAENGGEKKKEREIFLREMVTTLQSQRDVLQKQLRELKDKEGSAYFKLGSSEDERTEALNELRRRFMQTQESIANFTEQLRILGDPDSQVQV